MDEIKSNKFEIFTFVYLTILISSASFISENDILKIVFLGLITAYAVMKKKQIYNKCLFYLVCSWILINSLSSVYFGGISFNYQFFGKIVLIYSAFIIYSFSGDDFWEKYEGFLYKIIKISFVIYIIWLIKPDVIDSLKPIFEPLTNKIFYNKESQKNYFYAFFFVNSGRHDFRNCGFMWEPGAYAMVLIILITYNIAKYGLVLNKRTKLYLLALITTFSTAGYLALAIISTVYFIKIKSIYAKLLFVASMVIVSYFIFDSQFLLPKVTEFVESAERGNVSHQNYRNLYEANRILSFSLLFKKFLMFPLGWGCVEDTTSYLALNKIVTVNGIGNILVTWGGIIFTLFIYAIYKFYLLLSQSFITSFIFTFSILITFFSNPIENNILFYLLVLTPFYKKMN